MHYVYKYLLIIKANESWGQGERARYHEWHDS